MRKWLLSLCIALLVAPVQALAHGGGMVFVPVYIPPPPMVPPALAGNYDGIRSIAVLSALGNTMTMQNMHFLSSDTSKMDIADWHVDDLATATVQKYLGSRFAITIAHGDKAALAALPNGPLNNTYDDVRRVLKSQSVSGVDAFMVIRPDLEANTLGLQGLCYQRMGGLADTPPAIFANYEIDLYNAHTLQLIAKAYSRVHHPGKPTWFASVGWPKEMALDNTLTPSPAARDTMRQMTEKLIEASIVETLRALKLGVVLPGDQVRHVTPLPPEKDAFHNAKRIAIISALGDELAANDNGDVTYETVPGLSIDARVEARLGSVLAKRFEVVPAQVDRSRVSGSGLNDDRGKFAPHFPGISPSPDVDLYVVIVREKRLVWNSAAEGLGIESAASNGASNTALFANYSVVVLDAHTLGIMTLTDGTMSFSDNARPVTPLGGELWTKPPAVPPAESIPHIQEAAVHLMSESLDETVQHVGLMGVTFTYETTPNPLAAALPE